MANPDAPTAPLTNGSTWSTSNGTKASNNNAPTNGNARLHAHDDDHHLPSEQTQLTLPQSKSFSVNGDADFDESDTECGLGPCAPNWLQKFASKQAFLMVFCIAWVLQGMYHTYFVSAITTIEKLFQIQSKITGIIMSATEIGQIGSSLLLTYYGGQGHRPKWIAWGMVLFAVSSFTCSLPHFIYGKQLINSNDLTGIHKDPSICKANLSEVMEMSMLTDMEFDGMPHMAENWVAEHRIQPSVTKIVLAIFFISLLGVGMGQTAVYTLGIPYIDDNVASKESPLYFGMLKAKK